MRVLVLTQKVDIDDDILGFFHYWLERFARKADKVFVIANFVGRHNLPENVEVFSLGKEKGYSRLRKYWRFFVFFCRSVKKVDLSFFHMCPEYVLAAWPFFLFFKRKKILWYVHKKVSWKLRLAGKLVDKIFTVSKNSISLKSDKIVITGHGINLDLFKKLDRVEAKRNSVLYLGRISPVKRIENLLNAGEVLKKEEIEFSVDIVGNPVNKEDFEYQAGLKQKAGSEFLFVPAVKNTEAPETYNSHELFINLTPTGSFDKTILEAMACERLVLVCNITFSDILTEKFIFKENEPKDLAGKMNFALTLNEKDKNEYGRKFRQYVFENHNIDNLINKILCTF